MEIGIRQRLKVLGTAKGGGFWVGDRSGSALLAERHAPEGLEAGEMLEVFVYSDRDGNPEATLTMPMAQSGEFVALKVVDLAPHGAYLAWGLERDLFVPYGRMHRPLEIGDCAVVAVDVDLDGRLYGSTKLSDFFVPAERVRIGDEVSVLVYSHNERGVHAVVDGRYTGIFYHNQVFESLEVGDERTAWVTDVREDGRLDLSLQRNQRAGTVDASEQILKALEEGNGFLALTDKSPPAEIRATLKMSKKVFKKALGRLYKARKVSLEGHGIRRVDST